MEGNEKPAAIGNEAAETTETPAESMFSENEHDEAKMPAATVEEMFGSDSDEEDALPADVDTAAAMAGLEAAMEAEDEAEADAAEDAAADATAPAEEAPKAAEAAPETAETAPEAAETATATEAGAEAPKRRRGRPRKTEAAATEAAAPAAKEAVPVVKLPDRIGEFNTASRQERRSLYRGEDVFSIDEDNPAETEENKLYETFVILGNSQKTGRILEGVLSGVELVGDKTMCGVVFYNDYRVYIPQPWLFTMDEEENKYDTLTDKLNAQRYYTTARLGAKIRFIVRSIDEAKKVAFASRIAAMERDIRDNYIDRDQRGRTTIREGMTVQARITYVMRSGIGVDIMGAEVFIPSEELSYMYIGDCLAEGYEVNDTINVKIRHIEPFEYRYVNPLTGRTARIPVHLMDVDASHKDTMEDPNKKYFNYFQVGGRYCGQIIGRSVDGYFVRIAGMRDALIQDNREIRIPNGTKVSVRITKKNEADYRIYGMIKTIVKMYD